MLAYINNGVATPWTGQPINGVLYPLNVETLWSDAQLNTAGLYRVTLFTPPAGYEITGSPMYALVGTVVQQTYATIPIPPPPAPTSVSQRQAKLALLSAGLLPQVNAAIAADTTGVLQIWWDCSRNFYRTNAQLLQVASKLTPPLTSEQIDALFLAASKLT